MSIQKRVKGFICILLRTAAVFRKPAKLWFAAVCVGLPLMIGLGSWTFTKAHLAAPSVAAFDHWMSEIDGFGAMVVLGASALYICAIAIFLIGTERWRKAGLKLSRVGTEAISSAGLVLFGAMAAIAILDSVFSHINPWEWALVGNDIMLCYVTTLLARLPQEMTRRSSFDLWGSMVTGVVMFGLVPVMVGAMIQNVDVFHV